VSARGFSIGYVQKPGCGLSGSITSPRPVESEKPSSKVPRSIRMPTQRVNVADEVSLGRIPLF
jgi:hypothetical protein